MGFSSGYIYIPKASGLNFKVQRKGKSQAAQPCRLLWGRAVSEGRGKTLNAVGDTAEWRRAEDDP